MFILWRNPHPPFFFFPPLVWIFGWCVRCHPYSSRLVVVVAGRGFRIAWMSLRLYSNFIYLLPMLMNGWLRLWAIRPKDLLREGSLYSLFITERWMIGFICEWRTPEIYHKEGKKIIYFYLRVSFLIGSMSRDSYVFLPYTSGVYEMSFMCFKRGLSHAMKDTVWFIQVVWINTRWDANVEVSLDSCLHFIINW